MKLEDINIGDKLVSPYGQKLTVVGFGYIEESEVSDPNTKHIIIKDENDDGISEYDIQNWNAEMGRELSKYIPAPTPEQIYSDTKQNQVAPALEALLKSLDTMEDIDSNIENAKDVLQAYKDNMPKLDYLDLPF